MTKIKGQNLRISIGGKIVAASTSCSLSLSTSLEDSSTKDDTNSWTSQECVAKSWSGSVDALIIVDQTETGFKAFDSLAALGTQVAITFDQTNGDKNRTVADAVYSGTAIISEVSITAANKQNGTVSISFQGVGELEAE